MIDEDDEKPVASAGADSLGKPLDGLSLKELHAYVTRLQAEIERAEAAIAAKRDAQGAAESIFKKG